MNEKNKLANPVQRVLDQFNEVKGYHALNYANEIENWNMYNAKHPEHGRGQWPQKAVQMMNQQDRTLISNNITRPTVDAILTFLIQSMYDPEFIPVGDFPSHITKMLKTIFYSDKELMDWNRVDFEMLKAGLIHQGVMKMVISDRYDPLGNIGFEMCLPGTCFPDPTWKTSSTKDLKLLYKVSYLMAEDMLSIYKKHADSLKAIIAQDKSGTERYGSSSSGSPYPVNDPRWGSRLRVIERFSLMSEMKETEFIVTAAGKQYIPGNMEKEDAQQWLAMNVPDWEAGYIHTEKNKCITSKVKAICPEIVSEGFLEDSETDIQCGQLPFFIWSAGRDNGEPHAVTDSVKDIQVQLNYNSAMIINKLQSEGEGGAQLVEPDLFEEGEYEKWKASRNNPTAHFKVRAGTISKGVSPVMPLRKSPFPREAYELTHLIIDKLLPHTSRVTPSSLARIEQGNRETSGRLYQMLQSASRNLFYPIQFSWRQFKNEVYEAYIIQAAKTYSSEFAERTFAHKGESVTLNKETLDQETGVWVMENDFSDMLRMRHKVIISETQQSPDEKLAAVGIFSEFLNSVPPSQIGTIAVLTNQIAKNIEQFPEETKIMLNEVSALEVQLAKSQLELNIANIEVQKQQLMQAMSQPQIPQNTTDNSVTPASETAPLPQPQTEGSLQ